MTTDTPLHEATQLTHDQRVSQKLIDSVDVKRLINLSDQRVNEIEYWLGHFTEQQRSCVEICRELIPVISAHIDAHCANHSKHNKTITKQNQINDKYLFDSTGHLVVCFLPNPKINRPFELTYEVLVRDFGRTTKGNKKYMAMSDKGARHLLKKQFYPLPKYSKSVSTTNPTISMASHPFCWPDINKHGKSWEVEMIQQLASEIQQTLRAYIVNVERYKRMNIERSDTVRDLACNLNLMSMSGNGKRTTNQLLPLFSEFYPQLDLTNFVEPSFEKSTQK